MSLSYTICYSCNKVMSNCSILYLSDTGKSTNEKSVNIIRLNQQEVFQTQLNSSNQISGQTALATSSSKSIFSLLANVQKERDGVDGPNEQGDCLKGETKNSSFPFTPKKFVPAEKSTDWNHGLRSEEPSQSEKIKPKWSPNPSGQEQEPRYKKIQPLFQKPKSPHKIS